MFVFNKLIQREHICLSFLYWNEKKRRLCGKGKERILIEMMEWEMRNDKYTHTRNTIHVYAYKHTKKYTHLCVNVKVQEHTHTQRTHKTSIWMKSTLYESDIEKNATATALLQWKKIQWTEQITRSGTRHRMCARANQRERERSFSQSTVCAGAIERDYL